MVINSEFWSHKLEQVEILEILYSEKMRFEALTESANDRK